MTVSDLYHTIESASEGIYKEKGSKFLAYAYPVMTEDEIKAHIDGLKQLYYDARHHCFAWQLGLDGMNFRAYDDGEPSGTAGKPIHGQILSHELTNILIVVVRYFGGTKLGTSGLIRAYKEASADALANASIVAKTVDAIFDLFFDYGAMNDVMRVVKDENPNVLQQNFNLSCSLRLSIRQSNAPALIQRLGKIESVRIEPL